MNPSPTRRRHRVAHFPGGLPDGVWGPPAIGGLSADAGRRAARESCAGMPALGRDGGGWVLGVAFAYKDASCPRTLCRGLATAPCRARRRGTIVVVLVDGHGSPRLKKCAGFVVGGFGA